MFVRKKPNKSGLISVQVIEKKKGKYKLVKTIGSSKDEHQIQRLVDQGKRYIEDRMGTQKLDFVDYQATYQEVLSSIQSLKLVGVEFVLGRIFD